MIDILIYLQIMFIIKKHEGEESFRTIVNNNVDNEIQYGSINYNPENVYKDKLEIKKRYNQNFKY